MKLKEETMDKRQEARVRERGWGDDHLFEINDLFSSRFIVVVSSLDDHH